MRVTRALALVVVPGAAGVACAPPVKDLGEVELLLWQPADVDEELLAADEVVVTAVVDGAAQTRSFVDGAAVVLDDLRTAPTGGTLEIVVDTNGPDALARSGTVRVDGAPSPLIVPAVLAPPGEARRLVDDPADGRLDAAICGAPDGTVHVVGGAYSAGAPAQGAFVVDAVARGVRGAEGPGAARVGAACVADEDDVVLFGGCDADGAPQGTMFRSGDRGATWAPVVEVDGATACGAAIARVAADAYVVVAGARAAVVEGGEVVARATLDPPRDGATIEVVATDPLRVVVTGGADGALLLTRDGAALAAGALSPAPILVDGDVAVIGGEVVRLDGVGAARASIGPVPGAFAPARIAALPDGRAALLDDAGSRIAVVGDGAAVVALDAHGPRPGARLLVDRGGAIRLVGGAGAEGVLVVVPDAP